MRRAAPLVLLSVALAASAEAQSARERFALSAGGGIFGGHSLGSSRATFTENRVPTGGRLTYFDAALELEQAALWQARLGVRAFRGLWLEAGALAGRRRLLTSLANDFEGAAPRSIASDLDELQLEGGLRCDAFALSFGRGRGVPFVFASAAWLRQTPDGGGASLDRTGRSYAAGLGLAYRIASPSRGLLRAAGLRLEAGLASRSGGFDLEDGRRSAPRAALSFYAAR